MNKKTVSGPEQQAFCFPELPSSTKGNARQNTGCKGARPEIPSFPVLSDFPQLPDSIPQLPEQVPSFPELPQQASDLIAGTQDTILTRDQEVDDNDSFYAKLKHAKEAQTTQAAEKQKKPN